MVLKVTVVFCFGPKLKLLVLAWAQAEQSYYLRQLLFSLGLGQNQSLRFGPKLNTKVTFNTTTHPPTENFSEGSGDGRRPRFGMKASYSPST